MNAVLALMKPLASLTGDERARLSHALAVMPPEVRAYKSLPEPVCQGSLISFADKGRHVTLFLNPEGATPGKGRANGTLRMSLDGGRTWKHSRLLVPGKFAYSSMARLKDGRVGVLYETAGHGEILYLTVGLDWLEKN